MNYKKELIGAVKVVLLSAAVCVTINQWVFRQVVVVGRSMAPTLADGEVFFVNQWAPKFFEINVGDVVAARDTEGLVVKRVVARPGDTIEFAENGRGIKLNGLPLVENYLGDDWAKTVTFCDGFRSMTLGKDQYFLLGDNRNCSVDSRFYGPVARSSILGIISKP